MFKKLTLFNLYYLFFVILFGAFVRASKSGAGCGETWPLCAGKIFPENLELSTIIEYSHRITSGFSLVLALIILYLALPKGGLVKKYALWMNFFLLLEALLGAGLVFLGHVADNISQYRWLSMGMHLVNTYALLASAAWLCFFEVKAKEEKTPYLLIVTYVMISILGALTALGDTLFPSVSSMNVIKDALSDNAHLFVKLRIYHPLLALIWAAGCFYHFSKSETKKGFQIKAIILLQILAGFFNIFFNAPILMQLIHLGLAEILWIRLILN